MKKRFLSVWLTLLMTCSMAVGTYALSNKPEMQPFYDYTADHTVTLTISGGTATCYAGLQGYPGTTTRINANMTLQKKGLFGWSEEWDYTYGVYTHALDKTEITSVGSGTYRLKVVFTVYSGTASETITAYSSEVKVSFFSLSFFKSCTSFKKAVPKHFASGLLFTLILCNSRLRCRRASSGSPECW